MASRGSTGDGVKVSKLHDRESMKRRKYLNKTKKTKQYCKYKETIKRIAKLRGLVEKLQEDFKENKRLNKMCKQFNKLQAIDEISTLIYDRDIASRSNPNIRMDIRLAAMIAIGYFNKISSMNYRMMDVTRATKYMCSGHVLCLTFIAEPYDAPDNPLPGMEDSLSEEAQTFKAEIYYGTGVTEMTVYPKGVSVLMPGESIPTFLAHPAPPPCPPECVVRPVLQ